MILYLPMSDLKSHSRRRKNVIGKAEKMPSKPCILQVSQDIVVYFAQKFFWGSFFIISQEGANFVFSATSDSIFEDAALKPSGSEEGFQRRPFISRLGQSREMRALDQVEVRT
jgi:hypothetical protein